MKKTKLEEVIEGLKRMHPYQHLAEAGYDIGDIVEILEKIREELKQAEQRGREETIKILIAYEKRWTRYWKERRSRARMEEWSRFRRIFKGLSDPEEFEGLLEIIKNEKDRA